MWVLCVVVLLTVGGNDTGDIGVVAGFAECGVVVCGCMFVGVHVVVWCDFDVVCRMLL